MSTSTIHGYAAMAVGQPLQSFTYKAPDLGDDDVRVSVTHCGVCHTDIQAIEDYYGISTFPLVPGHEIVGNVVAAGASVSSLVPGDRVGIGWQGRSCGECEWCRRGETQLCMKIEDTTVMVPYGGFSSSVTADHRFVYPLPDAIPSESAAVLMCAGLTVYSALCAHVTNPALKVAIVGVGGLGHLAIQFAHAFGCEVTAISSSPSKENQALEFGAKEFLTSNDNKRLREAVFAFDLVVCTANAGIPWEALLAILKKRGKLVLLGFPDVTFNSTDLVAHELAIVGSLIGNPPTMRAMLSFAEKHRITPMVELMAMSDVNEAIQKLKDKQARYRVVLANDMAEI